MKKNFKIVILLLFIPGLFANSQISKKELGNLVMENIPDIPENIKDRLNQYQNGRSAFPAEWLAYGKGKLMITRFAETNQVHFIKEPGGARKQLTFFPEQISGVSVCPGKKHNAFIFTKDIGGNEFYQFYWFDLRTGKYELITDAGKSQNSFSLWSTTGNKFIYTSTKRNGKDYDVYVASIENPNATKMIVSKGGNWIPLDWSVDERYLILLESKGGDFYKIYTYDLKTDTLAAIIPTSENVSFRAAKCTADGKGIFFCSTHGSEFRKMNYYDLATKKITPLTTLINWNIDAVSINPNRTKLIFQVNENGIGKLYQMDLFTRKYTPLRGLPMGIASPGSFHPSKNIFSLVINSPKSPNDIYTYDLDKNSLTQWTFSEVGGLNNYDFVKKKNPC